MQHFKHDTEAASFATAKREVNCNIIWRFVKLWKSCSMLKNVPNFPVKHFVLFSTEILLVRYLPLKSIALHLLQHNNGCQEFDNNFWKQNIYTTNKATSHHVPIYSIATEHWWWSFDNVRRFSKFVSIFLFCTIILMLL